MAAKERETITRTVWVVISASSLSFILLVGAWGAAMALGTLGVSQMPSSAAKGDAESAFRLSERIVLLDTLLIQPGISICVGAFVGLLTIMRVRLTAILSLVPQLLFFIYGNLWGIKECFLAILYLLIGVLVAEGASALRRRRGSHPNLPPSSVVAS